MDAKPFIKDLLMRFDAYSKQLEVYREANGNGWDAEKILQEIQRLVEWDGVLRKQLDAERYIERNLLNENPPNVKKLERQAEKIRALQADREACEKKLNDLKEMEGQLSQVDELKDAYKFILSNLQDYRRNMPDIYEESERETGVFFFTAPR